MKGSWWLIIINNKDLGFPSGETWHRGGWVPLKFPWYCIFKFWFQDLAPRDPLNKSQSRCWQLKHGFYIHPYRYLEKWSNLTNTFKMGWTWSLEKIPLLVVSSIFTFTPTCRNGLKWPTSNVLQPHPSQITTDHLLSIKAAETAQSADSDHLEHPGSLHEWSFQMEPFHGWSSNRLHI